MEVLTENLGLTVWYLTDDEETVAVCSIEGKTLALPATDTSAINPTTSYEQYLEILDHKVIDVYINHQQSSRRVLSYELLGSVLWCNLYRRYGGLLFKLLNGPYQVYQKIAGTTSYLQVSGSAMSLCIIYGRPTSHTSAASTQQAVSNASTPVRSRCSSLSHNTASPTTPFLKLNRFRRGVKFGRRRLYTAMLPSQAVVGSHMFTCQPQPHTSPDRFFGRMSYTRWYYGLFGTVPKRDDPCRQLRLLHSNLRNLAFAPLVEAYTRGHVVHDSRDVFANSVPHWKVKQMIKKILLQLKVSSLMFTRKSDFHTLTKGLTQLFTFNRYTACGLSSLTTDIKWSTCDWLKQVCDNTEDRRQKFSSFVYWLVRLLTYIINYYFYVTESREFRKRTLFFRRDYWESRVESTFQGYIDSNMFVRTVTCEPANHRLRFLAGNHKLRPIMSRVKKEFSSATRYKLMDILACLKYVRSSATSGLATCTDTIAHLRKLSLHQKSAGNPSRYYFVKADIARCYDSIDRKLLLDILRSRLDKMNIARFMCWRIAVVLYGQESPTVSYTDLVVTDSHSQGSFVPDSCTEYLKRKGISTALFIPQVRKELTAEHLLTETEKHLEGITVAVERRGAVAKYKMSRGIPQGSILSSVLCDIYYGAMERMFLDPSLQGNGSLLLRHVDDYLLLTPSELSARQFLATLTCDSIERDFSCVIKKEKSTTNIASAPDGFERCNDRTIQWCQYIIDINDCTVTLPLYTVRDIHNSISFNSTVKPAKNILSLLLKHVSVFGNPIYLDFTINDVSTVESNITQIFRLCAVKFCYLQCYLLVKGGVASNPKLWLDVVFSVSRKLYRIVKNHSRRVGDELRLTQTKVHILCLEQFALISGSWAGLRPLTQVIHSCHQSLEKRQN